MAGLVVSRDRGKGVLGGFAIPLQAAVAAFPQLGPWVGWRLGTDPHLRQHWRPRARGVYQDTTPGWYFTGRTALLRELTGWLEHGSPGRAVRVVTGPAGTGKSAVLAWLCALSDPQLRAEIDSARPAVLADPATVPAAGRVSAAVWARGLDAHGAAGALAAALTLPAAADAPIEDVLAAVANLDPAERASLVVVLDALDEALTPREIARQLLVPLARDLGVKTLAGTRPGRDEELLAAFGERAVIYRLDAPAWFDRHDLADYAAACLRADFNPDRASGYRDRPWRVRGRSRRRSPTRRGRTSWSPAWQPAPGPTTSRSSMSALPDGGTGSGSRPRSGRPSMTTWPASGTTRPGPGICCGPSPTPRGPGCPPTSCGPA